MLARTLWTCFPSFFLNEIWICGYEIGMCVSYPVPDVIYNTANSRSQRYFLPYEGGGGCKGEEEQEI
jgi:hypothetical protein